ncbi:MAG: hypothetical protein ABL878_17270 [Burkholderiales bacterium]
MTQATNKTVDVRRAVSAELSNLFRTASAMKENAVVCYAAGMDDAVTKPVSLVTLGRKFAAWGPGGRVLNIEQRSSSAA